jgi:hypothetical protein
MGSRRGLKSLGCIGFFGWSERLGGVDVQQVQQSGLQRWGLGDDRRVVAAGRDEPQAGVAGLRWPDVDLHTGRISPRRPRVVVNYDVVVSEPKTSKGRRSLALDPATVAALREHRVRQLEQRLAVGPRWQDSGLVFTWPDGRPIHPERFSRWFEQHARDAGLPKIRLHDVRHSYATAALAAGVPAKVVSERLGHANIAITMMDTYSHVLPGLDAQAADTVARLILGDFDQSRRVPLTIR